MDQLDRVEAGQPQPPEVGHGHGYRGSDLPCLTALGFSILTFNSAMAIYRSFGDPASIAFVSFSYVDLVLLFLCLRWFEPGTRSSTRNKLKAAVWALTTLLTAVFSYKVAAVMPLPLAVMVWAMTATTAGGFYALFLHKEKERQP